MVAGPMIPAHRPHPVTPTGSDGFPLPWGPELKSSSDRLTRSFNPEHVPRCGLPLLVSPQSQGQSLPQGLCTGSALDLGCSPRYPQGGLSLTAPMSPEAASPALPFVQLQCHPSLLPSSSLFPAFLSPWPQLSPLSDVRTEPLNRVIHLSRRDLKLHRDRTPQLLCLQALPPSKC